MPAADSGRNRPVGLSCSRSFANTCRISGRENGFEIVGVSPDGEKSHRGFADKHGLQFTLIADTDKSIASAYGVWGQKKFMGREYMGILRTTFVIDGEGYIEKVFPKVNTKDHFRQIADSYGMK